MKRQKPNVTDLMKMIDHLDHSVEDLHDLISNLTIEYEAKT